MTERILSIECATDWLSVALLKGDDLLERREADARMQHAAALLPAIDDVLRSSGTALADLSGIAVSTGPGSFTSLRIGIATIKGLAFGESMAVLGVSTLEAMALATLEEEGSGEEDDLPVLALLDARRGQWYAGAWRGPAEAGGLPEPVLTEGLYAPEAIAAALSGPLRIRAPHPGDWEEAFRESGIEIVSCVPEDSARPDALWVGRLGRRRLARGEGGPASALTARYVRRAEAEAKRLGGPVESGEVARIGDSGETG